MNIFPLRRVLVAALLGSLSPLLGTSAFVAPTVRIPAGVDAAPAANTAPDLAELTGRAYRAWLRCDDLDLNSGASSAEMAAIFKWFKVDALDAGALISVLAESGPPSLGFLFRRGNFTAGYLAYHWSLNDAGGRGADCRPSIFKRLV
jgi:hypothetical protein